MLLRVCHATVLAVVVASFATAAEVIYVPLPLADKVRTADSTKLDIGEPQAVFDSDMRTLIRTPSINPAYIQAEFTEPITTDRIRLRLIDTQHTWTLAVADSLADIKNQRGSYRVLFKDRMTPNGEIELPLDEKITFQAVRFDVVRQGGDDYVHISEIQFCIPAEVESLRLQRIVKRQTAIAPPQLADIEPAFAVPVQTVVAFDAEATAAGSALNVNEDVRWECASDGIKPWMDKPGEFVITQTGAQELIARYADVEQRIVITGTARPLTNRRPDIEIFFVQRLPEMPFGGPNGGLPKEGDEVIWRAHVYNWGREDQECRYEWSLDGEVVRTGMLTVPVGPPSNEATYIDLPWNWTAQRHELSLTVKPTQHIDELITKNNTLTFATNAITFGLWVEQSLWDYHHEHQYRLPTQDANSFAGWGRRMAGQWNKMFKAARFAEYPDGITERIRLGKVVVVPDFALPLAGGLPSNNPDLRDHTVDMTWGCESGDVAPGAELDPNHWWSWERAVRAFEAELVQNEKANPPFWCGLGYIHEMAHARYLVDAYGFNVHTGHGEDISQRALQVTVDGKPVLGTYMPLNGDLVHWRKYPGQMGGNYWAWSVYDAMCWNRVAGVRARGGNCNSPSTIGEFLQDIPKQVIYEFVDQTGKPLRKADVWVYQAAGTGQGWYTKVYRDEPALKAQTNLRGRVSFDRTLWSPDGRIRHTFGHSNSVVLVRITYEGQHYFVFEEVTDPNIAYNLGHTEEYVFKRKITLRDGEPSPDEWDPDHNWDAPGTGFGRPVEATAAR